MTGHGAKFGRKMEPAITASSRARASKTPLAWREWLRKRFGAGCAIRNPQFKAEYLRARREGASQAIARLQQGMGAAAITMLKRMTDPNVPAAVRLRSSECVFSCGIKGIEVEDIEVRLANLEEATEANKGGGQR
jgi:hypothetical protein